MSASPVQLGLSPGHQQLLTSKAPEILTFTVPKDPASFASDLQSKASHCETIQNIIRIVSLIFVAVGRFLISYLRATPPPLLIGAIILSGSLMLYGITTSESSSTEFTKQAKTAQKIADIAEELLNNPDPTKQLQSDLGIVNSAPLPNNLVIKYEYFKDLIKENHKRASNLSDWGISTMEVGYADIIFPALLVQTFALYNMKYPQDKELTLDQVAFLDERLLKTSGENTPYCKVNGVEITYKQMRDNWDKPFEILKLIPPKEQN